MRNTHTQGISNDGRHGKKEGNDHTAVLSSTAPKARDALLGGSTLSFGVVIIIIIIILARTDPSPPPSSQSILLTDCDRLPQCLQHIVRHGTRPRGVPTTGT